MTKLPSPTRMSRTLLFGISLVALAPSAMAQSSLARLTPDRVELARPITFDAGTSSIDAAGRSLLVEVARVMAAHPTLTLEIGAHTDARGADEFNLRVSQARADAVRAMLVSLGIGSARLRAVGYGETRPLDTNATEAGRERNRRIELLRTDVPRRP